MFDWFKGTITPRDWAAVAVILSATFALAVLYYFVIYQNQQKSITAVEAELKTVGTDLARAREIEANIESLRAESEKILLLVNLFEQRLPEKREIPSLFSKFERMGNQLGLRVQLEALPTITDQMKETIPYKVTAWGDFHQLVSFINLLERDERYLRISELEIDEQEEGISEGSFTLSTFRFIQPRPEATAPNATGETKT